MVNNLETKETTVENNNYKNPNLFDFIEVLINLDFDNIYKEYKEHIDWDKIQNFLDIKKIAH